ncbi:phage portal protein [Rhodococcus sp. IEGM 1351]|uniref:phage portal protein n=1 Tax=Rhodococcus sp. IEGM 1351 TaxID=3047089 RepID=UPI0024B85A46|nr:phage portal protein [Rhodococcus sp. IEGM 1351]MDI9934700.1 phage portal protein [Rhodococcus sp. IEGM 1351]
MAQKNTPLRYKLAAALLGKNKAFIPHLSNTLDLFDGGNTIKNYRTKSEAITANLGWAFTANDAIVRPTAKIELKLYRRDKKGDREEIFDSPVLDLMKRPNGALKGKQMRRLHFSYMNFTGESYILMMKGDKPFEPKKGQLPDSLHILPAHLCEFVLGDTYSQSTVKFNNKEYPITSVIRELNPDPRNPYFGQSIITAAAATIDTDEQMKDWNRRFFANNARPGLIFSTKEEMSDDAYARWKAQFSDQHTGSENAYKNLLVENGDAKPYMVNQQDLDFLNSRKFTRDEIFAMFQTSPAVVGLIENANRSIMDGAMYTHTINNVLPRIEDFVELINTAFVQVFDPTLELDFENPVAEDKEAKLNEADKGVNKWMTIDEVRELYGMDALPDGLGAQIYAQGTLSPLSTIANATEPDTTSQDAKTTGDDPEKTDETTKEGKKSFPKPRR